MSFDVYLSMSINVTESDCSCCWYRENTVSKSARKVSKSRLDFLVKKDKKPVASFSLLFLKYVTRARQDLKTTSINDDVNSVQRTSKTRGHDNTQQPSAFGASVSSRVRMPDAWKNVDMLESC